MMDSPNVELVRSIFADWERGDFFSRADWADPEIEFVIEGGPQPQAVTGLAAMAQSWREVLSAVENFRSAIDECRELDDERVIVLARRSGRGRTSGIDVAHLAARTTLVVHIGNSKLTRLVLYYDRDRAFADLGLPRQGDPS